MKMSASGSGPGPSQRLHCVTYPGVVKRAGLAVRCLGGQTKVSGDLAEGRGVELRPHDAHAYHRAQFSNLVPPRDNALQVLVCAKRRRRRRPDGDWETEAASARVLGLLASQHEFRAFADFQYLPIRTRRDGQVLPVPEDMTDEAFPSSMALAQDWLDGGKDGETRDEDLLDLMAPPLVMSRVSLPSAYLMAPATNHRDEALKARQSSEAGMSCRKERKSLSLFIQGTEAEFPAAPAPEAVAYADDRIQNKEVHELLERLFEERPMWTRNAIVHKTGVTDVALKTLIGKFAFYISSGPWGRAWCRFGYDPRRRPEAVRWQTLMISFKNRDTIQLRHRLRLGPKGQLTQPHPQNKGRDETSEASWVYRPGSLPTFRQCFFCLADIHLPVVAPYLQGPPAPLGAGLGGGLAHPTLGFLPKGAEVAIRTAVIADVHATEARLKSPQDPASQHIPFPDLQHPGPHSPDEPTSSRADKS